MKMMTDKVKMKRRNIRERLSGYTGKVRTAPAEEMFMRILKIEKALM